MKNKKFKTVLRYRGSRDGWEPKDFHRMSDGQGPTITLYKVKENGHCIGGFTSAQWSSPAKATYVGDSSAMVFNLTKHYCKTPTDHNKAIKNNKTYGPCFGDVEFYAGVPINGDRKGCSVANKSGYSLGYYCNSSDGYPVYSQLTDLDQDIYSDFCYFTIAEFEVWSVMFE